MHDGPDALPADSPSQQARLDCTAEGLIRRKRSTWPEASSPAADLVVRLFRLRDLIHHASRRAVKERFGLTPAEFEVVVTLRTVPFPYALTPTELRQSMLITPGGLTKVTRNLEERRLVVRRPSLADRRSALLELTDAGVALAEQALPLALEEYARLFADSLAPGELEALSRLLATALRTLEAPRSGTDE